LYAVMTLMLKCNKGIKKTNQQNQQQQIFFSHHFVNKLNMSTPRVFFGHHVTRCRGLNLSVEQRWRVERGESRRGVRDNSSVSVCHLVGCMTRLASYIRMCNNKLQGIQRISGILTTHWRIHHTHMDDGRWHRYCPKQQKTFVLGCFTMMIIVVDNV
jgi:hypothetical protein